LTKYLNVLIYNCFGDYVKVKIFDESHESDLEKDINDFFKTVNEVYDIKYNVAVCANGEEQIYCFTALILYD